MRKPDASWSEEDWHRFLSEGGDTLMTVGRRVFTRIPADPRCRMCAAPFQGAGGRAMRLIGKRPSDANPNWCNSCFDVMLRYHGGAEIEGAMLFADVRGSTSMAERMSSAEFHALLDRFYATASRIVFAHDGFIDKFVGDEIVALFFPLLTGERYVGRAVAAAQELLRATGHEAPEGAWLPVGAGVHSGRAWFGAVRSLPHVELTAVGDAVNIAARLAAAAGPGEVLVSVAAANEAGLDRDIERRALDLKGKQLPTQVVTLRVGSTARPPT